MEETMEELVSRHRKELKAFEGEKRAALKKVKGTAGKSKKGKDQVQSMEADYREKEDALMKRHATELEALSSVGEADTDSGVVTEITDEASMSKPAVSVDATITDVTLSQQQSFAVVPKKKTKAQRRRDKVRAAEQKREAEIAEEARAAGPSPRQLEMDRIAELYPDFVVREIPADGNCLYRAVASQVGIESYRDVRAACAESLRRHREEFAPFAEVDGDGDAEGGGYDAYVDRVANSSEWGGHLELRALALALRRPIVVYSAYAQPVVMGEEFRGEPSLPSQSQEIRLSFHKFYYALGEHYNALVPKASITLKES